MFCTLSCFWADHQDQISGFTAESAWEATMKLHLLSPCVGCSTAAMVEGLHTSFPLRWKADGDSFSLKNTRQRLIPSPGTGHNSWPGWHKSCGGVEILAGVPNIVHWKELSRPQWFTSVFPLSSYQAHNDDIKVMDLLIVICLDPLLYSHLVHFTHHWGCTTWGVVATRKTAAQRIR